MHLIDVRPEYIASYDTSGESIQKATVHLPWNQFKKQFTSRPEATVVLLDESCFMRYHISVKIRQEDPLTRDQYKKILSEKLGEVMSHFGVKAEYITYDVRNMKCGHEPMTYILGESGVISFDICYFIIQSEYSDIVPLSHVRVYPRWYFLLSHPLIRKKERLCLLAITGHNSTLIQLERGRYKKISTLNGGDDLLRQAYEQAGLDPLMSKKKDFNENSIGEKLLIQAYQEYTGILMGWIQDNNDGIKDMMLVSRLIDQPYFVDRLSEVYINQIQGRMIPYRGSEIASYGGRTWQADELPVMLLLQHIMNTQSK